MASTEYDYTKTPCAVDQLAQQIQTSAIATPLDYINLYGAAISIFFTAALSAGDKTILDTIIANHTGVPLTPDFTQLSSVTDTSTNSGNYTVLNSMVSPQLQAGTYFITFSGTFSSNALPLTNPGVLVSLFNDGVQAPATETVFTSTSISLFPLSPVGLSFSYSVIVGPNKVIDIRWKNNGSGNTIHSSNRNFDIMRIK
jgi:hypothetical protein